MMLYKADMPSFVMRELEKLEQMVSPFLKKASRYAIWSILLISISVVNLFILLFVSPTLEGMRLSIFMYALIGAVGMAFSKEAKFKQKEVINLSTNFIIERMRRSDLVTETTKMRYISLVKDQPLLAIQHLVKFLEEERAI
ncbi:DUF5392 family protein [Bacillus sp. Marseille-P3661]|uniref:DUF5392 family protein n=1 Tax=Bacillus sp. Marseille-P3661 TaxID=1936234 RepID=UPI0015E176CC|nr:DUF5392 family protein [Bacillus sp. Marseille-P3661]